MASILVVDDDPQFARSVVRSLERAGHRCDVADDGDAVQATAERLRPDVVVMDLTMPRRSGLEAFRDLRESTATEAIPVIVMTARADVLPYVVSQLGPSDDHIAKPFHPAELEARIEAVLRRARAAT